MFLRSQLELLSKMDPSKVSVVMVVYNAENSLGDAVESFLRQSFMNFEFHSY